MHLKTNTPMKLITIHLRISKHKYGLPISEQHPPHWHTYSQTDHIHTCIHKHIYRHRHSYTHIRAYKNTHTHTHKHSPTYTQINIHMHTNLHTHRHRHIQTNKQSLIHQEACQNRQGALPQTERCAWEAVPVCQRRSSALLRFLFPKRLQTIKNRRIKECI